MGGGRLRGIWTAMVVLGILLGSGARGSCREEGPKAEREPPAVSEVEIRVRNVPGEKERETYVRMVRDLIRIKAGDRFSPEKIDRSIEALKLSNRFKKIHADAEADGDRFALIFEVTPARFIKNILIDGNFPLLDREVLNVMTLQTGDPYLEERLEAQEERIEKLFKGEGFVSPEVRVTGEQDPGDGNYLLRVEIDKGDYLAIERIDIEGNEAFWDPRLKIRMKTWPGTLLPGSAGRLVKKNIETDMENLLSFHREQGYAEAGIDHRLETDPETHEAVLHVTIDPGPRYEVEFEGNEEFWSFTLKGDVVLFDQGNLDGRGIRKSVRNIRDRYRSAGYLSAEVETEIEEVEGEHGPVRRVRFVIDEGVRSIVRDLSISGNEAFDDEKIKNQMVTRPPGLLADGAFNPEELKKDKAAIQALYYKDGFLNTEVSDELDWENGKADVSVAVDIDEGVRTRVSEVAFEGLTVVSEASARKVLEMTAGDPFRRFMVQSGENALAALISEKGFPHVRVQGEVELGGENREARVLYTVDEGPYVEMGSVYLTGNFRTRDRVILREMEIRPGEAFSAEKMLATQRNIRDLDIFDAVRFKAIGLKDRAETVDLFVEMEEKKPYVVRFGIGYDTERNLYAKTRLENRNLMGLNLNTWLSAEASQIGYRADYGLTEPRLLSSHISATVGIFAEERDEFNQEFGTRTFGGSVAFARDLTEDLSASLGFRYEQRDQFRHDDAEATAEADPRLPEDEFRPRSIVVATPALSYDTRDSFVDPQKGTLTTLSADVNTGIDNDLDDFVKYRLDTRWYYTPFDRLTLALRGRIGHISPYGATEKVPDDQLFFLGGTSDVRGFKENMLRTDDEDDPVGGKESVLGSLEARIEVVGKLELTLFYDTGTVTDTFHETSADDYRHSAGAGLRYVTPIGPVGFLYGHKLDRKDGESPGRFHFSLGYTF